MVDGDVGVSLLFDDRDEHARTDARPACAPEATGSAGNILAAVQHLHQCAVQVDVAAGVFIGGQQCSPHHYMMLWSVHMAKRHGHRFLDDINGVF